MFLNWMKIGAQSAASAGSFWLPPQASKLAANTDNLFYFIYYLCVIFFIVIIAAMVYFVFRYRKTSENQRTEDIKGNHTLEVIWTFIPTLLLLVMFAWGFRDWLRMSAPRSNALEVRVTGQKWVWSFAYPAQGVVGANELVVPVGRSVKLTMSSKDVLHSFFVPDFRIKRDVVPNRYTVQWFEAMQPGVHDVLCTEYCGTSHSTMLTKVKVVSEEEFKAWVDSGGGGAGDGISSVEFGARLYEQKGCNACHSIDGSNGIGPSFKAIYGRQSQFVDGSSVTVDDNYIRESIMDPMKHVVKGYQPVMPSFKGQVSDKQVDAIIDYLKSLN